MIKGKKRSAGDIPTDNPKKLKNTKTKTSFDRKSQSKSIENVPSKPLKAKKLPENGSAKPAKEKKSVKFNPRTETYNDQNKNHKAPKDGKPESAEKTDWVKFKREKKELRLKRRKTKDYYETLVEAKKIYEKLKCKRTQNKSELVKEIFCAIENSIQKLAMAHDTARIIQCMLKHASPEIREQICDSLRPVAVDMATSKYSHFCILRMFKYGSPATKSKLLEAFYGNIVKLSSHNISSKILDYAYLTVANDKQKNYMRQEFYSDLYKNAKDDGVSKLSDTFKEEAHMKTAILGSLKANLEHVANKQLVDSSLVHAVILEYLQQSEGEKLEEIIEFFAPMIPMLVTTKEGCQSAIICFHQSTPKNRRAIIKAIKEHLVKICIHEQGYVFILAVLNSLDDTKAMKKAIYDTIHPELQQIMSNQWGRRVIEWFISPADTKCFHPAFIAAIEESLKYGKKEKDMRRKEILDQIEEPIANAIAECPDFWLSNRHIGLVTAEILNKISSSHFITASTGLASVICKRTWTVDQVDEENGKKTEGEEKISKKKAVVEKKLVAGIEEPGLHTALKKILKHDLERQKNSPEAKTFGSILVENLTDDTVKHWLSVNRACFILLHIVENNSREVGEAVKNLVDPHESLIDECKRVGGKLLLQKLQTLNKQ